ncbi:HNH endonuclease [Actinoplanes sp. NBC_00393]|uniref:HNH endonuclease n=1 Tax=Actinoplanes sp. NBC_00393 TaxID=2975953 RepID=UPI002E214FC9
MSTCTVCRRPTPYGVSRCSNHKPTRQHSASASRRGYNYQYQLNRRTLLEGSPLCSLCGLIVATTADHVVPLSRGGTNELTNLRPACGPCNYGRGNRP